MRANKVKLYKFYADWCMPCKQQAKIFEETPLKVEIINVNVDEDEELCKKFEVRGLPTLILVDNEDNIIKSWHRLTGSNEINALIDED